MCITLGRVRQRMLRQVSIAAAMTELGLRASSDLLAMGTPTAAGVTDYP
jgi:hypothetical protein